MFYNNEIATLTLVTSFILSEMYLAVPYFLWFIFALHFYCHVFSPRISKSVCFTFVYI